MGENTLFRQRIDREDFVAELVGPAHEAQLGLVIVPSSAGICDCRERFYADFFAKHGFFCCIADAFTHQHVQQCLTDQTLLPEEALLAHARIAHGLVRKRCALGQVGILGVSKGGWVALHAALELPNFAMPSFAFHLSLVPPVHLQLRHPQAKGGALLVLMGEKDDFTPKEPTIQYLERIKAANPQLHLEYKVMPGLAHAWESQGELHWLPTAERYDHCSFFLEEDGSITDQKSHEKFSRKEHLARLRQYARLGAHYGGGTPEERQKTCDLLLNFVQAALKE